MMTTCFTHRVLTRHFQHFLDPIFGLLIDRGREHHVSNIGVDAVRLR